MTNQNSVLQPAIDELEKDLVEAERHVNVLRTSINLLRAKAGLSPRPDGGGGSGSSAPEGGGATAAIRNDQFFGKKGQTAVRELLALRKAQGSGPATTREIFDSLSAGGFTFEAKDDNTAMIGLRAMLRKRSETFVKLQNGNYGLLAWYPDVKKSKQTAKKSGGSDSTAENHEQETASPEDEAAA